MPELAEVETIRRDLERQVVGRRISAVEVKGARSVRRESKKTFVARLTGRKITGTARRGKYLVLRLDSGEWLVVHLRMSGQLRAMATKEPMAKHTHVVVTFDAGGQLRFVDPRTFGELFVVHADNLAEEAPELAHIGFDPLDEPVSWIVFGKLVVGRRGQLKAILMDQKVVAGIGNIYSDEILHAAGLRYDRFSETLSTMEIRRLYRSVLEILHEAVKHRGSTLSDEQYVDLFGKPGSFQSQHQVYDREGKACPRCRAVVERAKFQGRSTYYCPNCQI